METSWKRPLLRGAAAGAPFVLVAAPFGALFGVIATEAGLNLAQVMTMSVLVIAGASQVTAIQLMQENAPAVIIVLTSLAVNLRMAMYSAALAPHMGPAPLWQRALASYFLFDQPYAVSHTEFEKDPGQSIGHKMLFFTGSVLPMAPVWYGSTLAGALIGQAIPEAFALDFAVPITFLALVAPALRSLPHVVAALVSTILALGLMWVPYSLGLIIAAVFAMAAGAMTEVALERRKA
ncbi:MAG: AzlC family ABC transporter permease [Pseudomonadota bacterium]